MKCRVEAMIMRIQAEFCHALEKEEEEEGGKKFLVDKWDREQVSVSIRGVFFLLVYITAGS